MQINSNKGGKNLSIIKESFIYKMLLSLVFWIENKIKDSYIYNILTKENKRKSEKRFF